MTEFDWNLFGVNEKSTLKELKNAFFNIALITHPDKNQGVSKEEFSYVLREYKKIKDFLQKKDECDSVLKSDKEISLTEIEAINIENEDKLVRDIPSFMSIYEEVHDNYKNFNIVFEGKKNKDTESEEIWNASHSFGYDIEKSEYASNFHNGSLEYTPLLCNLTKSPKIDSTKKVIIDISRVESGSNTKIPYTTLNDKGTLQAVDNFTTISHIDYIDAFKQPCFLEDTLPSETLEKFKAQEKKFFENIEYSPEIS